MIFDSIYLKIIPRLIEMLSQDFLKSRARVKLLISELKFNLKQFEYANKFGLTNQSLLRNLTNKEIIVARNNGFIFSNIKIGM
jgi:hypothetical protein